MNHYPVLVLALRGHQTNIKRGEFFPPQSSVDRHRPRAFIKKIRRSRNRFFLLQSANPLPPPNSSVRKRQHGYLEHSDTTTPREGKQDAAYVRTRREDLFLLHASFRFPCCCCIPVPRDKVHLYIGIHRPTSEPKAACPYGNTCQGNLA